MAETESLTRNELELEDALFGRPALPPRRSTPAYDDPAMREALAAMDRAGRETKAWREKRGIR